MYASRARDSDRYRVLVEKELVKNILAKSIL
jgi:hypothetical protein